MDFSPAPFPTDATITADKVWFAFEAPSLFGVCFPTYEDQHQTQKQAVYVPYLSALSYSPFGNLGSYEIVQVDPIVTRLPLVIAGRRLNLPKNTQMICMSVLWMPVTGAEDSMTDSFLTYYTFDNWQRHGLFAAIPWNSYSDSWSHKPHATREETDEFIDDQISRAKAVSDTTVNIHGDFQLFLAANNKSPVSNLIT